jgi:site-specific DNA recombinase
MKKTAVIYARYSTDLQKDRSIEDQIMQAAATAKRFGYEVTGTYRDRAISGASMVDREGLLDLMAAAKQRKFDAVICESLSRLSRDEEDTAALFKRLGYNDIRIIDQNGEITDIHASIGGIVNAQFLKNLTVSIRRSMHGRIREGLSMGKINYGYRGVLETLPNGLTRYKPGVREIDPTQAEVVVRIFEEYVSGKSPRSIAADLTSEGIPSLNGGKTWNPGKLVHGDGGLIGNQIYIGKLVWNKHTHVKNPDTGKRHKRRCKEEDQVIIDVPHLRILPQKLWESAQALRAERGGAKFGLSRKRTCNQKSADSHLLVGLLRCGACGGNMVIGQNNTDGSPRVVCSYGHRRIRCDHHKSYDLKVLEATVLAGVKERLTRPKAVIEYTKSYHARWAERQKEIKADRSDAQRMLVRVTVQIDRIISAISDSDGPPVKALTAKLNQLEAERSSLEQRVSLIDAESNVIDLHPTAVQKFCSSMTTLHQALTGASDKTLAPSRATFRNVFERIVVHPTGKRKPYEVTPYARLSAITGIDLFPKVRSTKEMLAEQGYFANRTSVRSVLRSTSVTGSSTP